MSDGTRDNTGQDDGENMFDLPVRSSQRLVSPRRPIALCSAMAACLAIAFSPFAAGTTSGTLAGDEFWSGVIVLTGDVIVPDGVTLTVAADTLVKAATLADDQGGGVDSTRVELIIEGTLNLQSAALSPATFTSDRALPATPTAGDWYGIRLTDTAANNFTIHDAIIEAAVRGIWGHPGSHQDVVNCIVRDTTMEGMYLQFGNAERDAADPGMLVSGNTVERTGPTHSGIYLTRSGSLASWDDAVHQVVGNTTVDTGQMGLRLVPGNSERLEITGNFADNALYGIRVQGSNDPSHTNRVEITGNQVTGTSAWGLYQNVGRSLLIANNTVSGGNNGLFAGVVEGRIVDNTLEGGNGSGIVLQPSTDPTSDMYVLRNNITSYGAYGIEARSVNTLIALYNTITNLRDGIKVTVPNGDSIPRVHWNNIQGSSGYDAALDSFDGADLRRNFWSDTNAEMLAEGYPSEIGKIFDIGDNGIYGRIDYRGVEAFAIDTGITLESRIVWPQDGDLLSRRTITLEGTAYAANGVQLVEISTDGGSSWLPATGTDFWTFPFTPTMDGLQTFQCRVTDVNSTVEAIPDLIAVNIDSTQPTTEGTIPQNEFWSGNITLTGDVTVPAGTTLTIDPAATIRMQALADNSRGGLDGSRIELIVEGDLIAQGTGAQSILLTTESISPALGHWYGLRYTGFPRALTELRGLSLEWGVNGISDSGSAGIPSLDGIAIQQMQQDGIRASQAPLGTGVWAFRNLQISGVNRCGAWLSTGPAATDILIEGSTVQTSGREALVALMDGGDLTLRTATFENSNFDTVEVHGARDVQVDRVSIQHSSTQGEAFYLIGPPSSATLTIDDSEIFGGQRSVYVYRGATTIRRTRITGGQVGVYLWGDAISPLVGLLEYNHIGGIASDGVYVREPAVATLHYNDLVDIGGYALNNQSIPDIDAADNYWGEDATIEMNASGCSADIGTIYDRFDDGSKGLVTYCGYATEPFGDEPVIYFHDNAGQYEIHWQPKGGLTVDLIRGDVANLAIALDSVTLGAVTCQAQADGTGAIVDLSGNPNPSETWVYLVRDHVTPGSYGRDPSGRVRSPASGDCP